MRIQSKRQNSNLKSMWFGQKSSVFKVVDKEKTFAKEINIIKKKPSTLPLVSRNDTVRAHIRAWLDATGLTFCI